MTYKQISIRKRLMHLLMAGLCAISAIMFFEARSSARTAANEAYDRALLGSALAILERVLIVGSNIEVDIPYVALEMLVTDHQDRIYYQVETQGGQFLTGYGDLPDVPEEGRRGDFDPVFYDGVYKGENVRIGVVQDYISSPLISTRVVVKVAETTDARDALIDRMVQNALLRQFILILVAALIMWLGISWGLKPLIRLQEALNRRNPDDLHPIQHDVPVEVQSLIAAINSLMGRLFDSMASMRRFTSNAAHQLRTPLAAIQTQTELALKTQNAGELHDRLGHLKQSTQQSTRLVNQLLSLARATPGDVSIELVQGDIVELCRSLTVEMVPKAMEKQIDLGFESEDESIGLQLNPALIKEALKNLIENAITYCPENSVVTVKIKSKKTSLSVQVEDDGPGIPEEKQASIFDRFERAGRSDGEGCGLGLSIVREIIERHGGTVYCQTSAKGGLSIELCLNK